MPFSNDYKKSSSHFSLDMFSGEPTPSSSASLPGGNQSAWKVTERLPGFVAAGLFDESGLIIDGYTTRPEFNIEQAAGSFIMLIQEANHAGSFMGLGASQEVQIDYANMMIILRAIRPAPRPLILGIAVQKGAPLGRIRLSLDQLERALIPHITGDSF